MLISRTTLAAVFAPAILCCSALAQDKSPALYAEWQHSGVLTILTTPDGANLPDGAVVEGFPLLVRLNNDWFEFSQAKPDGEDVRFSTGDGVPLPYQLEWWERRAGIADIWVRMPRIAGNARQTIRIHWGKADAESESNGKAVFNESNGYLSVWHLSNTKFDDAGSLLMKDTGTGSVEGVAGSARHFADGRGIVCGEKITDFPEGSAPHSTEAWIRAEKPNGTIVGWGNEEAQGKAVMQFRSPPHIRMDCYFSGGDVASAGKIAMNEWVHVMHTYQKGESRIYVNGVPDGTTKREGGPLNIRKPARMFIGGWYNNYDFAGDVDEVRVSNVVRSPEWVRLQYENQKPLHTLVGPLVRPGAEFGVSPAAVTVKEGDSVTFTAQAGGAQKIYWSVVRDGAETLAAVDRFAFVFQAGRVTGDKTATVRFKAVTADGVKTQDMVVSVKEAIAEPEFTLLAPAAWDGRERIEIVPVVTKGTGTMKTEWSVAPFAVIKEAKNGKLILKRALNSGRLTVTATMSNGGKPVTHSVEMDVKEPQKDAWIAHNPAKDEKPEDGQFYARDESGEGTLYCDGMLAAPADSVFVRLYADGKLVKTETAKTAPDNSYALGVKLKAGLIKYRVEFGVGDKVLHTADDLVCGDAFVVNGQSNAVATDWGEGSFSDTSEWVRSFGSMGGDPKSTRWGKAARRGPEDRLVIGYWAFDLAKRIVEREEVPVCIINGAVGGTRIDQHQRNDADPADLETIYGRLLWRVREARLTHGIRGVLWHQGENDQGADGPTGGYGWETYRQYFLDLAAAWKTDFPNIRHYHVFQIWPKSCAMGINGSDNRLREVQRTLPSAFSNMSIMSTLGIEPPGGCHYPAEGYAEMARLIAPPIERDHYGRKFDAPVGPPDLKRAGFISEKRDEITLEFDQPVKWDDALAGQFYLDGERAAVAGGRAEGNLFKLQLGAPSTAKTISYLDSKDWSQKTLLRGLNGIAALTFWEVPLADSP